MLLTKIFILVTVTCALTTGWSISSHQPVAATHLANQSVRMRRELSTFFKSYELLDVDSRQVAQQVRQLGRFRLVTSEGDIDLDLAPHDMRGHNYRATKVNSEGVHLPLVLPPPHTFKGMVAGVPDSQARFTIEDDRIEGLILRDGERYHLESARRFSTSADRRSFVFYKASDVINDMSGTCGVSLSERVSTASRRIEAWTQTNDAALRVIELATESDFEFVSALGGAANAISEVLGIMNQVEGVYETQLGLTFQIVFQNAWETAADPYTTTSDSIQIINEFINYWNANFSNVGRDVAHMWTGKDMGGVLGRGAQSVACKVPFQSYGISRLDDRQPIKYITTAHEIAHNLGATHADGVPQCNGSIMRPTTTSGLTFCEFSQFEIAIYLGQSGQCLSDLPPTHSITGEVTDVSGRGISGVMIAVSGSHSMTTQTDAGGAYSFNELPQGESFTVTPSRENYAFTPQSRTFNELGDNQMAHFTVTNSPDGPVLVTEGSSNRAIALDSVLLLRDPFSVFSSHFSPDGHTRVLLFAYNAALMSGEDVSAVTAQAEDSLGNIFPLAVNSVETVPALTWLSQITVTLPSEISNSGDVRVSIRLRGAMSNKALISIVPSGGP